MSRGRTLNTPLIINFSSPSVIGDFVGETTPVTWAATLETGTPGLRMGSTPVSLSVTKTETDEKKEEKTQTYLC